jgi:hypothetical protein
LTVVVSISPAEAIRCAVWSARFQLLAAASGDHVWLGFFH